MARSAADRCRYGVPARALVSRMRYNWLSDRVFAEDWRALRGVMYYLSRETMEETFRKTAIASGSVVVFDYGTDANIQRYRKPLGRLTKAVLKAVREPQTFWISSEPPVKKNLAALLDAYGLSLREHLNYGRETSSKRSFGGLAAAVLEFV